MFPPIPWDWHDDSALEWRSYHAAAGGGMTEMEAQENAYLAWTETADVDTGWTVIIRLKIYCFVLLKKEVIFIVISESKF